MYRTFTTVVARAGDPGRGGGAMSGVLTKPESTYQPPPAQSLQSACDRWRQCLQRDTETKTILRVLVDLPPNSGTFCKQPLVHEPVLRNSPSHRCSVPHPSFPGPFHNLAVAAGCWGQTFGMWLSPGEGARHPGGCWKELSPRRDPRGLACHLLP